MRKTLILFILVFFGLTPALIGIFHPGFFSTDDGNWMVIRLSAFYETLRSGQFPVRFLSRLNNGYGYPVSDFLYPLFLYLGTLIHALHFSYIFTVKLIFGISLVGSGLGSFLWLRKKFSDLASITGSLIFSLFPYHIWDITKRGSVGEVLALGIAPFIFWQVEGGNWALSGLFFGLLILAHNTLAILFFPIIIAYGFVEKRFKAAVLSSILGIGLSAFFWIPALFDKQFTVFDKTVVSSFSEYFHQTDIFQLTGIISLAVFLLSLFFLRKAVSSSRYFLVVFLLSLFFTTSLSSLFWHLFNLGTYVQFPFRFLSITALAVGFLGAFVTNSLGKNYSVFIALFLLLVLYISSWRNFTPSYQYYPDSFYSTNQATTTVQNEYMPRGVKASQLISKSQNAQVIKGQGNIRDIDIKGTNIQFTYLAKLMSVLQVNFVYFPGWKATVDGRQASLTTTDSGLFSFPVMQGVHKINVWFAETPVRIFADLISLISFFAFAFVFVWSFYKKR